MAAARHDSFDIYHLHGTFSAGTGRQVTGLERAFRFTLADCGFKCVHTKEAARCGTCCGRKTLTLMDGAMFIGSPRPTEAAMSSI